MSSWGESWDRVVLADLARTAEDFDMPGAAGTRPLLWCMNYPEIMNILLDRGADAHIIPGFFLRQRFDLLVAYGASTDMVCACEGTHRKVIEDRRKVRPVIISHPRIAENIGRIIADMIT